MGTLKRLEKKVAELSEMSREIKRLDSRTSVATRSHSESLAHHAFQIDRLDRLTSKILAKLDLAKVAAACNNDGHLWGDGEIFLSGTGVLIGRRKCQRCGRYDCKRFTGMRAVKNAHKWLPEKGEQE